MRGKVAEAVAERVNRLGPVRFDEVVELALYHEEAGFYARGGGAGRGGGDFLTSPEVGPLFGAVLARAIDTWWAELGHPDPYVVVEAGAGSGVLAHSVLAAEPACGPALRYVLVERSPALRLRQARRLPLEPPHLVLGPPARPGMGPLVASLPDLPAIHFEGAVVANELLDNMPFRLLERSSGADWLEVFVTAEPLGELLVPASEEATAEANRFAPAAEPGARIPIQHRATAWLREALAGILAGRVVVIDYCGTTPNVAMRPWTEWVRTYRGHGRGGHPLDDLGEQDITCEVAVDQLSHVRRPTCDRSQAEFLGENGIEALAQEAQSKWQERAHLGDLEALEHRSRVTEAAALTDARGLGAFRVLAWERPA